MRAVIYCRVSSDNEPQIDALSNQIKEAKDAVSAKGWFLIDTYIDEAKTGTTTKNRKEYIRLVEDIKVDKFDVIVVKSQDRLMRSSKEWFRFIDILVQNGKELYFYLEDTFYSVDDALRTGVRAILADEYSRELSKKVSNAHHFRQHKDDGTIMLPVGTWGYDKVGKDVVINESEAEAVRMMFSLAAEGYGTTTISRKLAENRFYARTGKMIQSGTIRAIIRNPLYIGVQIMNKRRYDFELKKSIKTPIEEWIYKKNAVPPIIEKEIWQKANENLDKRARPNVDTKNGKNKGINALSKKIICGKCGEKYWTRVVTIRHKKENFWCCSTFLNSGLKSESTNGIQKNNERLHSCDNIQLSFNALVSAINTLAEYQKSNSDVLIETAMKVLKKVIDTSDEKDVNDIKKRLDTIRSKRENILDDLLNDVIDEIHYQKKDTVFAEEEKRLLMQYEELIKEEYEVSNQKSRIELIREEIEEFVKKDMVFDFFTRHILKIIVFENKIQIHFDIFPVVEMDVIGSGIEQVISLKNKSKH